MSSEPDTSNDGEVVDGLPVPAAPATPVPLAEPPRPAMVPAVQAAALAATGFVAGAATAAVVSRRRGQPGRRRRKRKGAVGEIMASNSFLVDVHLIRRD
jgi:hypothetical protein